MPLTDDISSPNIRPGLLKRIIDSSTEDVCFLQAVIEYINTSILRAYC